jgi:hypothetical protein
VETPALRIDAATHMLGALSQIADRLPCTRRQPTE